MKPISGTIIDEEYLKSLTATREPLHFIHDAGFTGIARGGYPKRCPYCGHPITYTLYNGCEVCGYRPGGEK